MENVELPPGMTMEVVKDEPKWSKAWFLGLFAPLLNKKGALFLLFSVVFPVAILVTVLEIQHEQDIRSQAQAPLERKPFPVTKKVLILEFNPIIETRDSKRLNEVEGWNNPPDLENEYIQAVSESSAGYLNYQIVERQILDVYPVKSDGFVYTDETYLNCWEGGNDCHDPDIINYKKMLTDYQVCEKRNSGEIDELWLWGAPYFGYAEANMAGPKAFWTNGSPITGTTCQKQLNIMGFSYERGVPEMLEDLGHRAEGTMAHLFGKWSLCSPSLFDNYTATEMDCPGKAVCGSVHVPANGQEGYDWSNQRYVDNTCEDWLNYPNLTGTKVSSNCSAWNCDNLNWKRYWLSHLPRYSGRTNYLWNNWWAYLADYEEATFPNLPKGYQDTFFSGCQVRGWSCDVDKYSQSLQVQFYDNNLLVGQTEANIPAENTVSDLCGKNPNHRFDYTFPLGNSIYNNQNHLIKVVALDIDSQGQTTGRLTDLNQTPLTIFCPNPSPSPLPVCPTIISSSVSPLMASVGSTFDVSITYSHPQGAAKINYGYLGFSSLCNADTAEGYCGNFERSLSNSLGAYYVASLNYGGVAALVDPTPSCSGGQNTSCPWTIFNGTVVNLFNSLQNLKVNRITTSDNANNRTFTWNISLMDSFPTGTYSYYAMVKDLTNQWQDCSPLAHWDKLGSLQIIKIIWPPSPSPSPSPPTSKPKPSLSPATPAPSGI